MKELKFEEEIKKEDWEPLFGKFFIHIQESPLYNGITLYHVVPTEMGFALYWHNTTNSRPYEEYQQFGTFREPYVNRMVSDFISLYLHAKLETVEETDVAEVENLMREIENARRSMCECSSSAANLADEISDRISSLIDHN